MKPVRASGVPGVTPKLKKIGTPSFVTASQNGRHDGSSKPRSWEMLYA